MAIIVCPTMQLGLDPQYPNLGQHQRRVQLVGIHPRTSWHSQNLKLLTCWPPSPCVRLSRTPTAGRHARDYYEASSAPPHGQQPDNGPAPTAPSEKGNSDSDHAVVPTFTQQSIGQGGAQLYSGNIATPTPQAFNVAS